MDERHDCCSSAGGHRPRVGVGISTLKIRGDCRETDSASRRRCESLPDARAAHAPDGIDTQTGHRGVPSRLIITPAELRGGRPPGAAEPRPDAESQDRYEPHLCARHLLPWRQLRRLRRPRCPQTSKAQKPAAIVVRYSAFSSTRIKSEEHRSKALRTSSFRP